MKRTTAFILAILLVLSTPLDLALQAQQPAAPQPAPSTPQPAPAPDAPRAPVLKEGTEVKLKFAQKLSSRSAVIGDPVELVLDEDLKVGDAVVARKGARARGTVMLGKESEKKRAGAHELAIRLEYLKAGDTRVKLRGERGAKGKVNKGATVGLTLVFGLTGLLIGLSTKHFEIQEGTPVSCYVAEDVELKAAPEASPSPPPPAPPNPRPPSASPAKPHP